MSDDKTGGQAFPTFNVTQDWDRDQNEYGGIYTEVTYGMTLRDWFAGQALAASGAFMGSPEPVAERAYRMADAMLRARKAGTE